MIHNAPARAGHWPSVWALRLLGGNINYMNSYSNSAAPLAANVPIKWFAIGFAVILAGFLVWYMINRRG